MRRRTGQAAWQPYETAKFSSRWLAFPYSRVAALGMVGSRGLTPRSVRRSIISLMYSVVTSVIPQRMCSIYFISLMVLSRRTRKHQTIFCNLNIFSIKLIHVRTV